ncbi:peptidylprolyl isomerase [Arthrobacter jiangjiafuii]|uniref:peptidylprolyl isomerase n=1 Tax=Arthrobacter jiangjiafuii TaxID=2817475 RepID=UPI001F45B228|nr:peptidylprolyl isomerase [Arthrobacter jiangjiafuii]
MTASRQDRETRRRIARMQARRALLQSQAKRRKRDNIFAATAAALVLALAVALQVAWFSSNPTPAENELIERQAGTPEATADPTESASPASDGNATNIPDPSAAEGRVFSGTLATSAGELGVELDGNAAPQAVAVFSSLAESGFFTGKTCHRLTTADTMGVLQCGSLAGDGAGDPDYQWGPVENTPADGRYPAGTIAVARGGTADSNGTQFFIAYKDSIIPQNTGGYTIMGKLTSGLDVLDAVAAQGAVKNGAATQDGQPKTPVTIDSFTLK